MNRALLLSVIVNLVMLVIAGILLMRCLPTWRTSTANTQHDEPFAVPHGSEGGPSRLAVIVCQVSDDPHSVASRVLARRKTGGAQLDVDVYVAENESIDRIVDFLKVLASEGIASGVRIIVPTSSGPVTLKDFNTNPLSAFRDIQEYKDMLNK
jgi:hypothetical protein